jgi:hypothetical protein
MWSGEWECQPVSWVMRLVGFTCGRVLDQWWYQWWIVAMPSGWPMIDNLKYQNIFGIRQIIKHFYDKYFCTFVAHYTVISSFEFIFFEVTILTSWYHDQATFLFIICFFCIDYGYYKCILFLLSGSSRSLIIDTIK